MEMSSAKCRLFGIGLTASLVDMIWIRCKYYALCCCVFKIVVLYVTGRFVLYCSGAPMRLRSLFRNYSVEAFYNDVPECVGKKTFRKTREIHNFSMMFSSKVSLCLEGYFHKRCIPVPGVILSCCKYALDLCFITSYSMIAQNLVNTCISDRGLLSVSCPMAQGTLLWYLSLFADLTHPEMHS